MPAVWTIAFDEMIGRQEFNQIASKLGIIHVPMIRNGNAYCDTRLSSGVEIHFGGQADHIVLFTNEIRVQSDWNYEAMKKTVLDLSKHIELKEISGEWFNKKYTGAFEFTPDVFKVLEGKKDKVSNENAS